MANSTSTDIIRRAAQLIRERAQYTTPGEWYADGDRGVYAHGDDTTPGCPIVFANGNASRDDIRHIAGFGPLVATAIADWLDLEASMAEKRGSSTDGHTFHALTVARAYLAPTSTPDELQAAAS